MVSDPNPGPDYQEAELVYFTMRSVQVQSSVAEMMASTMAGGVGNFVSTEPTFEGPTQKNLDEMKLLVEAYSFFGTFKGLIVGFLLTKAVFIHGKLGYSLRIISFCSTVSAFVVFLFIEKHGFGKLEMDITYALFIGAIILDTIAAFKLLRISGSSDMFHNAY